LNRSSSKATMTDYSVSVFVSTHPLGNMSSSGSTSIGFVRMRWGIGGSLVQFRPNLPYDTTFVNNPVSWVCSSHLVTGRLHPGLGNAVLAGSGFCILIPQQALIQGMDHGF